MKSHSITATVFAAAVTVMTSSAFAGNPRAYFEQSTLSGANNEVTIDRIPVATSNGVLIYKDIVIRFDVAADGTLSLASGSPTIIASQRTSTGNFVAGKYFAASNGLKYTYRVSGPGSGVDGRTTWNVQSQDGNCGFSASWTSGALAGHPQFARLKAAGITYAGYSYGVMGNCSCNLFPSDFRAGDLVGVAATAGGLTVFNYTGTTGIDHSTPISSATLTLCAASGC